MNKVILIGRLTRDPELRTTPNNLSVATFSLAVARPYNPQGNDNNQADFINCVIWRRQAENLAKYCHKGSQIAVEGRIQTRTYNAQDGTKRYVTEVLCDNITFLGTKEGTSTSYQPTEESNYVAPIPQAPQMPTTNLEEDPFKDFGEEITLSDDDLPF